MRILPIIAALAITASAQPVWAFERAPERSEIEARAQSLRAGRFIWAPERAADGPVQLVISLADQRAYVFRGGILIGASRISSGREGYDTPIGRFQILEKKRHHRSNRYNDAPMPFMQRLNWYGVALHGGHVPDYPASHGCIRLPMAFARHLFGATERGSFVFVTPNPIRSPRTALALARANALAPMPADRTPEWIRGTQ